MVDELNKASFKPRFVSEFSMGELDFLRYNEWLKLTEHWSAVINCSSEPTLEMIQGFFSCLVNLYDSWRPIIAVPTVAEEIDKAILNAKIKKRIWEKSIQYGVPFNKKNINDLVDLLSSIKTRLYEIKQLIGLGIVVKRNMSTQEKIRMGIHGDKNFTNLPEA